MYEELEFIKTISSLNGPAHDHTQCRTFHNDQIDTALFICAFLELLGGDGFGASVFPFCMDETWTRAEHLFHLLHFIIGFLLDSFGSFRVFVLVQMHSIGSFQLWTWSSHNDDANKNNRKIVCRSASTKENIFESVHNVFWVLCSVCVSVSVSVPVPCERAMHIGTMHTSLCLYASCIVG